MSKISFTTGLLTRIDGEFFTLMLLNGAEVIYRATVDEAEACRLIIKHSNIVLAPAL